MRAVRQDSQESRCFIDTLPNMASKPVGYEAEALDLLKAPKFSA